MSSIVKEEAFEQDEQDKEYDSDNFGSLLKNKEPTKKLKKKRNREKSESRSEERNNFIEDEEEDDESYNEDDNLSNSYNDVQEEDEDDESYEDKKKKKSKKQSKPKKQSKSKRKKEKKKGGRNEFIESEAESGADEEEEEADGDGNELTAKERDALFKSKMSNDRRLKDDFQKKFIDRPEEEIIRNYEEVPNNDFEVDEEFDQQSRQPSSRDPKLWLVKCKLGQEKECVSRLYHKYFYFQKSDENRLKFCSAICFDSLKGQIYIEAHNEAIVRKAIEGISFLRENSITIVPSAEMSAVFNYDKVEKPNIKKDQWVRIKSGPYEGDLAQIVDIEDPLNRIYVRLIPRLEKYKEDENKFEPGEVGENRDESKLNIDKKKKEKKPTVKKNIRDEQKLFQHKKYPGSVKSKNTFLRTEVYTWKNMIFKDGFLIKIVKLRSLIVEGVDAKIDELKLFEIGKAKDAEKKRKKDIDGNEQNEEMAKPDGFMKNFNDLDLEEKRRKFVKGDKVKIIKSSLINLTGVVESHSRGQVQIRPDLEDYNEILELPEDHVIKIFLPGSHVKVVDGVHSGKNGLIVKIVDDYAYVFSESTLTEFKVSCRDLVLFTYSSYENENNTMFEIDSLVKENGTGRIYHVIDVKKNVLRVIDTMNEIKTLAIKDVHLFNQMKHRINGIDEKGNPISIGDTVKVKYGMYKGKKGTIKNIFKNFLFLHNFEFSRTNGIFVDKAEHVEIMGSELLKDSHDLNNQSSKINIKKIPEKFKNLVGQTVKISGGNWKGYQGVLKSINEKLARVELNSRAKVVSVDKNFISDPTETRRSESVMQTPRNSNGFKTPAYYPQSPYNPASPKWNPNATPHAWQSPKSDLFGAK